MVSIMLFVITYSSPSTPMPPSLLLYTPFPSSNPSMLSTPPLHLLPALAPPPHTRSSLSAPSPATPSTLPQVSAQTLFSPIRPSSKPAYNTHRSHQIPPPTPSASSP